MRAPLLAFLKTVLLGLLSSVPVTGEELDLKFAGALEFTDKGTLFVGDNQNGSIYAFDMSADSAPSEVKPIRIDDIDVRIANMLGVRSGAIEINDMEVHPVSREVYISVTRIGNRVTVPAIAKVAQDGKIEILDLDSYPFSKQALSNYPDQETTFGPRGLMDMPPTARELAKTDVKISSLAIMDMVYHENELFVSGVAYDNFLSALRRIPYPFKGTQATTSVQMYHIAHDQYETRAPIRAMSIHKVDGKDQLVAAYTCSPLVLIPLEEIVDGAKISARAIGDMGNGQPIDMIPYTLNGQSMLFVTNNSRSPQVIPLNGLNGAKVVTDKDFQRGFKLDTGPVLPFGPVGEMVMFESVSLHLDLLSDKFFVSVTRDVKTGSLNLDSVLTFFPSGVHNLMAEYDFPQYQAEKKKEATSKEK